MNSAQYGLISVWSSMVSIPRGGGGGVTWRQLPPGGWVVRASRGKAWAVLSRGVFNNGICFCFHWVISLVFTSDNPEIRVLMDDLNPCRVCRPVAFLVAVGAFVLLRLKRKGFLWC